MSCVQQTDGSDHSAADVADHDDAQAEEQEEEQEEEEEEEEEQEKTAQDEETGVQAAGVSDDHGEMPAPLTSASGLPLTAVQTTSSEWTDEVMALEWTQMVTIHQLRLLRDFFVEGMTVNVVEEKVYATYNSHFS